MNPEPSVRRLGIGLAVVGVVLAAIAGFLVVTVEGTEDWVEVEGVVVNVDKEEGVVVGTTIRYRDAEDNTYDVVSDYGTEESRRGEPVMIQYNPDSPTDWLLAGESQGVSSHVVFLILFGLMAVWGVVIALFDPQLPVIPTRPGGLGAAAFFIALSAVLGLVILRNDVSGLVSVLLWIGAAAGLGFAFGVWRLIPWARWAAAGYVTLVLAIVIITWTGNENRLGAPLFWNLLLVSVSVLVLYAITRRDTAAAFTRYQEHRKRLATL